MRTRILLRHDPLFAVGLITHRRNRHPLRALAREIARRLAAARALPGTRSRRDLPGAQAARRIWGTLPALLRAVPQGPAPRWAGMNPAPTQCRGASR